MDGLTHLDVNGNAIMVDVGEKAVTNRIAVARGEIRMNAQAFGAIANGTMPKGDVLGVARVAGILAVKRTPELIPLCHPLMIDKCTIDFTLHPDRQMVEVECRVKVSGKTGVEMEALTGVSVTLLTIYDMCKAVDKSMTMGEIRVVEKKGGKSDIG